MNIRKFYLGKPRKNDGNEGDIVFVNHSNGKVFSFENKKDDENLPEWISRCVTGGNHEQIGNLFNFLIKLQLRIKNMLTLFFHSNVQRTRFNVFFLNS